LIAIIDYGVGNLKSVEKAFQYIGADPQITSDPDVVRSADGVVLPGVGAYADAMNNLRNAGMIDVVKDTIRADKPFLGICLGLQLLFGYSEEGGGRTEGLGIFSGGIRQIPAGKGLKVPHMGWNSLDIKRETGIFRDIPQNSYVYFVHSYYLSSESEELVTATACYGVKMDVAIGRGNVHAVQFHPEKSGHVGLKILSNWLELI